MSIESFNDKKLINLQKILIFWNFGQLIHSSAIVYYTNLVESDLFAKSIPFSANQNRTP